MNTVKRDYDAVNEAISKAISVVDISKCATDECGCKAGTPEYAIAEKACGKEASGYPPVTMTEPPKDINFTIFYKLPESLADMTKRRIKVTSWLKLLSSQSTTIFKKTIVRP